MFVKRILFQQFHGELTNLTLRAIGLRGSLQTSDPKSQLVN